MFSSRNKNYKVSLDNEDLVTPEETLLDSGSDYSDMEKPIPGLTFRNFLIFFGGLFIILTLVVFKIAIIEHDAFAKLAFQNKSANFPLPPPRGLIVDRNNQPLVKNVPVFNLLAVARELKENTDSLDGYIDQVAAILGQDKNILGRFIRDGIKTSSTFFVALNLTKDQALALQYSEFPGFYVVPNTKRDYIDGIKISQVVGYTGKVSKEDLTDNYYFPTDVIGRLGIESQYENYLRGTHGNIFFSRAEGDYITKAPVPGETVKLNIDHDLQIKLHDEIFEVLRESGLARAAGIIQDPANGEVLALVSFPTFDNNIFSSEVSAAAYKKLFENQAKPLFNRIISGLYNPGSTIKPLMGLASLEENIMSPADSIRDCINLVVPNPYDISSPYVFNNWRTEYGLFNLKKSIANSCNIYFFTVGGGNGNIKGLGVEKIDRYLKASLADSVLGIDIAGETGGLIPTPEWKLREKGEPWYLGDTYNISIGQGDLLVTPLWINSYISGIANGGTIYKPYIARQIVDEGGRMIEEFESEPISTLPFSKKNIDIMKEAMSETVISGTAQILKGLPVKAAAKTGTAEVVKGRSINSLFTVFAPYDNPKIAMTVLVEGSASNQGLAIRAAYNTLKWYFGR